MKHSDFSMGLEFISGGKRWRCTDIGTRTIAAMCLSDHPNDKSWFNGPPYASSETIFDEYDFESCTTVDGTGTSEAASAGQDEILAYLAKRDKEITTDELSDVVSVRHQDGSVFLLMNARLERRGKWFLIFAEHHAPQLFYQDDVTHWTSKERSMHQEHRGSTWYYQAYRDAEGNIQIYEDYFDESGAWQSRTAEPVAPMGESSEELVSDLYYMLHDAMVRPVKELDSRDD